MEFSGEVCSTLSQGSGFHLPFFSALLAECCVFGYRDVDSFRGGGGLGWLSTIFFFTSSLDAFFWTYRCDTGMGTASRGEKVKGAGYDNANDVVDVFVRIFETVVSDWL